MKKFLSIILAAALLLACVPGEPIDVWATEYTEGDYTYTVSNGAAEITDYNGAGGDITIPSTLGGYPVISIGDYAFYNCNSLTSATIPVGVTTIGYSAFRYCSGLTGIWVNQENTAYSTDAFGVLFDKEKTTLIQAPNALAGTYIIPDSVIAIVEYAFYDCASLTDVTIGRGVTTIGTCAFAGCTGLTSVTIGGAVTTIEYSAFSDCTSLPSVTIPDSVTTIGNFVFSGCDNLTGIWVDEGNTAYSSDAAGVLLSKEKTILLCAPGGISGSYTIPAGVTEIVFQAFASCANLTAVTIPASVESMDSEVFAGCDNLTGIWVDEGNAVYSSDAAGVLFSKDKTALCEVPRGISGSYTIPDSVTTIEYGAFSGCNRLYTVTIGNSVKYIDNWVFTGCENLTTVTIPNSVEHIGAGVFAYCPNLTTISIPNGITSISEDTFSDCVGLTTVTIPNSVTYIDWCAFYNCTSLTNVYYTGTQDQWDAISIGIHNNALTEATIHFATAEYTVTFQDWDGTVLSSQTYKEGDTVTAPADPTRPADDTYVYTFAGWDKPVTTCTGDAVYTATYTATEEVGLPGDANGDGKVNNLDAILILQWCARWDVTIDEKAANVNGDGKVNNLDAILILQYCARWDVTLGPQ